MKLSYCTFTGVDEETSLSDIISLSNSYPIIEWGFLFSPKQQGQPGRYLSTKNLLKIFEILPVEVKVALHFCGSGTYNLLNENLEELDLLKAITKRNGRIQLNFNQTKKPINIENLKKLILSEPKTTFITQHNQSNNLLWNNFIDLPNYAILFDSSGGNGISCNEWPKPLPVSCGYAGGLGPNNIKEELQKISSVVAKTTIWIDMENKLRNLDKNGIDWLNIEFCEQCIRQISKKYYQT